MRNLDIVYDDIRLKRKSEDNIFAFISIRDPYSIRRLVKGGLNIQGKNLESLIKKKDPISAIDSRKSSSIQNELFFINKSL